MRPSLTRDCGTVANGASSSDVRTSGDHPKLGKAPLPKLSSPLPMLDPGRGRTKTGRLWAYARDDRPWNGTAPPAMAYVYDEDRKGERPAMHLGGFAGILQVDGYSGFKRFAGDSHGGGQVRLAFC